MIEVVILLYEKLFYSVSGGIFQVFMTWAVGTSPSEPTVSW